MKNVEITCTKKQKDIIVAALLSPQGCLWPRRKRFCAVDDTRTCKECFEKNIKWDLTDKN